MGSFWYIKLRWLYICITASPGYSALHQRTFSCILTPLTLSGPVLLPSSAAGRMGRIPPSNNKFESILKAMTMISTWRIISYTKDVSFEVHSRKERRYMTLGLHLESCLRFMDIPKKFIMKTNRTTLK